MNEERFSRSMETSINQFPTLYMFTHPQAFRPYVSGIMMDEGEIDEACARFEQAVQTQSIHRRHRDAFADPHLIADHVLLLSFP